MAKQRSYKKEFIEKVKQKFYHDLQPNSNPIANNNAKPGNDKASKVISEEDLQDLPKPLATEAQEDVIFKANEGPQEDFLAAGETDVLYGGAAGAKHLNQNKAHLLALHQRS